jgi:hypothetical protein
MKINIGAGNNKINGFLSCDYDTSSNPDYVVNLETDSLPFANDSVETVVAHHILEHLGEGYFHCLQELYRVCKNGAIIDIRVPHHRHDNFHDDPTHRRPITVGGMQLFSKKFNEYCKISGAASSRLGNYYDVDFEILDWNYIPVEKYRDQFEGLLQEEVEEYIEQHSNIIHELYIKLVVIKN